MTRKLTLKLFALILATFAIVATSACQTGSATQDEPLTGKAALSPLTGSSYVACYFGTPGAATYEWALEEGNGYFVLTGQFRKTAYTGIEKFFSTASTIPDVEKACIRAQAYYGVSGELFGMFAAFRDAGYNYPLVINNVELNPQY